MRYLLSLVLAHVGSSGSETLSPELPSFPSDVSDEVIVLSEKSSTLNIRKECVNQLSLRTYFLQELSFRFKETQ